MGRFRHRQPLCLPAVQHPGLARPRRARGAALRLPAVPLVAPAAAVIVLAVLALSIVAAPSSNAAASPVPSAPDRAALQPVVPAPAAGASGVPAAAPSGLDGLILSRPQPSIRVPAPSELSGYVWPLARGRVTLPFGPTEWGTFVVDGAPFHDGVDMATFCGDRVVAAHDGVVLAEGRRFDEYLGWRGSLKGYFGRLEREHRWYDLPIVIVIDDENGYRSMYAHLDSTVVNAGDRVKAGQLIGYEGRTGNASGCHLHFGLFDPDEPATFQVSARLSDLLVLPHEETARINPLEVLPFRPDVEEMRVLQAPRGGTNRR